MGLDHLGPSSAVLLQFMPQSAQELSEGPAHPKVKQAAEAKQTTPIIKGKKQPASWEAPLPHLMA